MVTVPARAPEGCETVISGASVLPLRVTVRVSVILLPVLSAMVILPKLSVTVSPSARWFMSSVSSYLYLPVLGLRYRVPYFPVTICQTWPSMVTGWAPCAA